MSPAVLFVVDQRYVRISRQHAAALAAATMCRRSWSTRCRDRFRSLARTGFDAPGLLSMSSPSAVSLSPATATTCSCSSVSSSAYAHARVAGSSNVPTRPRTSPTAAAIRRLSPARQPTRKPPVPRQRLETIPRSVAQVRLPPGARTFANPLGAAGALDTLIDTVVVLVVGLLMRSASPATAAPWRRAASPVRACPPTRRSGPDGNGQQGTLDWAIRPTRGSARSPWKPRRDLRKSRGNGASLQTGLSQVDDKRG